MNRIMQAELLDRLPAHAPDAIHSRRDLRWINGAMRNRAWFRRELPGLVRPGERVLEIGAGDGAFARGLRSRVPQYDGLDLGPRPADWPATAQWHQIDVRRFGGWDEYPVVIGNLIFHHFPAEALVGLGTAIRRHARVFAASEPLRGRRFQLLFAALCPLIGANHVTRHDGRVSIAAGFAGNELPRLLGFDGPDWSYRVHSTPLGAYRVVAVRT